MDKLESWLIWNVFWWNKNLLNLLFQFKSLKDLIPKSWFLLFWEPDSYGKILLPHEIVDINLLSIELPSARQLKLHYYPLHPLTPYTLYHIISFSLGTMQSAVGYLLTWYVKDILIKFAIVILYTSSISLSLLFWSLWCLLFVLHKLKQCAHFITNLDVIFSGPDKCPLFMNQTRCGHMRNFALSHST